jgi:hypothetical protein
MRMEPSVKLTIFLLLTLLPIGTGPPRGETIIGGGPRAVRFDP